MLLLSQSPCLSPREIVDWKPGTSKEGGWHKRQLFPWPAHPMCLLTRCPVPTCFGLTSPFPAPLLA